MDDDKSVSEACGEVLGVIIFIVLVAFTVQYAWNNAPIQYCLDNFLSYPTSFCFTISFRALQKK